MMTTRDVLGVVGDRVSYRQLDYWLRTRRIVIADDRHGSGFHRLWTPAEVAALDLYVTAWQVHRDMTRLLADGSVWRDCLHRQRVHVVRGEA